MNKVLPFQYTDARLVPRTVGVLILVALTTDCSLMASPGGEEIDRDQFRTLYDEATEKLSTFCDNVGMVIRYRNKVKSFYPTEAPDRDESWTYVYKARSPLFLLESRASNSGTNGGEVFVKLVNKNGVFDLRKPSPSRPFLMEGYGSNYSDAVRDIQSDARVARAAFCEYSVLNLNSVFDDVTKTVKTCRRLENQYIVDYWYRELKGLRIEGKLVLDAERTMAQLKHTRTWKNEDSKFTVEYEGESKGIPLVKRVEHSRTGSLGFGVETWEVEKYLPRPIPESDFTLKAYGIKDPFSRSRLAPWTLLLTSFIVCVIVAIVVQLLRRRRSRLSS